MPMDRFRYDAPPPERCVWLKVAVAILLLVASPQIYLAISSTVEALFG